MGITIFDNWGFGPTNDNTIGCVLDPRCFSFIFIFIFILFCFFLHARKFIYKIKNVRNKKNYLSALV